MQVILHELEGLFSEARKQWQQFVHFHRNISGLQKEIAGVLLDMGLPLEQEVVTLDRCISLDIMVKLPKAEVGVECDGMRRYTSSLPRKALGDTVCWKRLLKLQRVEIVSVAHHEWVMLRTVEEKRAHLRQLLEPYQ